MPAALSLHNLRPSRQRGVWARVISPHWRGERGPLAATLVPSTGLLALFGLSSLMFDSVDWVWHYRMVAPVLIALITLMLITSVWGLVGAARSGVRADDMGESRIRVYGAAAIVAACAISTAGQFAWDTKFWLSSLWVLAKDQDERATIVADPALGRLVIRGPFGFGTTRHANDALHAAPWVRLVELESPGGYAIEGLALAKLLESRAVDTLVLKSCASACITAFAAGNRRYLGPLGRLGLHSAGPGRRTSKLDVNQVHASFLRQRGVAPWLINGELDTPFDDLWVPGPATLLGSGLVTDLWKLR